MLIVLIIDVIVIISLLVRWRRHGIEEALPLAAFFLIFFPEESKLPVLGLFDITTQRLVTMVLLCFYMADRSKERRRRLPLKMAVLIGALWWAIATVNSIALADSIKSLLSLLVDYLAIYVIFAKCISSTTTVRRVLLGITAGLIASSIFGVFEAYQHWSVLSLFPTELHRFGASGSIYVDDARGVRVQSTFGHPILFGSALAMGIPTVLFLLASTSSRRQKVVLWLGLLLMFVCIFKTSSRGPWIALFGSLVPFILFGHRRIKSYIVTICLLTITVLIVRPGVLETLWNDYAATVDNHSSQGESYQYRYVLYDLVTERLNTDPARMIWGYGPQSFPYLHLSGTINGRWMTFASCDSSFAALLAETGYFGLLLACSFLFYVLIQTVRNWRACSRLNAQLCILFFANLVSFYFEMTNVAIFGWGQQTILLWIIIAMTMIYPSLLRTEEMRTLKSQKQITNDENSLLSNLDVNLISWQKS